MANVRKVIGCLALIGAGIYLLKLALAKKEEKEREEREVPPKEEEEKAEIIDVVVVKE